MRFVTAILLFNSQAILVTASGYLYTALALIPGIRVFPAVFAPAGPMGDVQSTPGLAVVMLPGPGPWSLYAKIATRLAT